MLRLAIIFIICTFYTTLAAQEYIIDVPKHSNKDNFSKPFVHILNDAPHKFKNIKDKPFKGVDSAYLNKKIIVSKIKLPNAGYGKIIQDSISFIEFNYGVFTNKQDAEAAFVNLTNQISESMSRKVLFKAGDTTKQKGLVKQTKIAFTQNSGFFQFNIFVQLTKVNDSNDNTKLTLYVKEGKPAYYYKIMKNEPVNSFMFVTSLKSQLITFDKTGWQGCLGTLQPFVCKGTKRVQDTVVVFYEKGDFEFFADAKSEFETALTNMRVCMRDDYVYYLLKPNGLRHREVAFLKFDDIELEKRKTVHLALIEKAANSYYLELGFAY